MTFLAWSEITAREVSCLVLLENCKSFFIRHDSQFALFSRMAVPQDAQGFFLWGRLGKAPCRLLNVAAQDRLQKTFFFILAIFCLSLMGMGELHNRQILGFDKYFSTAPFLKILAVAFPPRECRVGTWPTAGEYSMAGGLVENVRFSLPQPSFCATAYR